MKSDVRTQLEVGMYARFLSTNITYIRKITSSYQQTIKNKTSIIFDKPFKSSSYSILADKVLKANHNIKKLLEVGDFIDYEFPTALGMEHYENVKVTEHLLNVLQNGENNHEYHILSVLTKEQMEAIQYKVVE